MMLIKKRRNKKEDIFFNNFNFLLLFLFMKKIIIHNNKNKKIMEAELCWKWECTSPFTFEQLLEYWVQQHCDICGRGNTLCIYGQTITQKSLSTTKTWSSVYTGKTIATPKQTKLQQLHACWNGMFCSYCGRGGFVLPTIGKETISCEDTTTQNKDILTTTLIAHVPKAILHQTLRDWVLCKCGACGREGDPSLRTMTTKPIPLDLVIHAWRGNCCQICGRGSSSRVQDVVLSPQTNEKEKLISGTHKNDAAHYYSRIEHAGQKTSRAHHSNKRTNEGLVKQYLRKGHNNRD